MEGTVSYQSKNGTGIIEFHHPKGNSLPGTLLAKLKETIEKGSEDEQVAVLVLKSKGKGAFCAGASFDELSEISDLESGRKFFSGFAKVIMAIKNCPKFVVGRIHGKAVGGGVGLIAACDYAIATDEASIKLSELNLGIGPFVIAPAVQRKIGLSAFSSLTINASAWKKAAWACEHGLYNELCSSIEELDRKVSELSGRLAKSSPGAMKEIKAMLWEETGHFEKLMNERAEQSGRLVLSDFTRDFLEAFKKRA